MDKNELATRKKLTFTPKTILTISKMENKICFIDTCILSQAISDKSISKCLIKFIVENKCFCGITVHTLSELHKRPKIFEEFHQYLNKLPFFLIKPTKLIVQEEFKIYPKEEPINISLANFQMSDDKLKKFTTEIVEIIDNEFPIGAINSVINHIDKLKENYPPKNGKKYENSEIITFCELVVFQQLTNGYKKEVKEIEKLNSLYFKSLKSQTLMTFWKFYKSGDRKIRDSDTFDISMSSCFPYFDIIFTENNMANDILQIQRSNLGYDKLKEVYTIKKIRSCA